MTLYEGDPEGLIWRSSAPGFLEDTGDNMTGTRGLGYARTSDLSPRRRMKTRTTRCTRSRSRPTLELLETRQLLATFVVTNTNDSGPGSLRQAILSANGDAVADNIEFDIPASTAPNLDVPVPGFDPGSQTWTIALASPLPPISNTISIDGYSQAHAGVPYRYPNSITSAVQTLSVLGSPTGGSFTLTTSAPLPVGTTAAIPYNATAATVRAALGAIVGMNNVVVSGGPAPDSFFTITFQNTYAHQFIPNLGLGTNALTGGIAPDIDVFTLRSGGTVIDDPTIITSIPNTTAAKQGNNARVRVIIDGSAAGVGATGFELNTSHSVLRGLVITNFGIGVSVPNPGNIGNLIQGNFIGDFFLYPVDTQTGSTLAGANSVVFASLGANSQQGIVLYSSNTTVGGSNPQENNVICGNGLQGILIQPGASGNQVLGNQIGMAGPSDNGLYAQDGNGAEGVLILSSGTLADPLNIVYSSSNIIGSATGGNLISGNGGSGVRLVGVGANRNLVQGNYIGIAPGGEFRFGTGNPGNEGDGIRIEDGSQNLIGGFSANLGNTIASNHGAGVYLTGTNAIANTVANNMIGVTATGQQVLGNSMEGVTVFSPRNTRS